MKTETKPTPASKQHTPAPKLFEKGNYTWMLIGAVVMILGFLLMVGGKSKDVNTFDESAVYSTTRITIAPILIIAGLLIEVFAIMRKPKNAE